MSRLLRLTSTPTVSGTGRSASSVSASSKAALAWGMASWRHQALPRPSVARAAATLSPWARNQAWAAAKLAIASS